MAVPTLAFAARNRPLWVKTMKDTPIGSVEIRDAHAHFFSYRFFESLASQLSAVTSAANPLAEIGETMGWDIPPVDPAALAGAWVTELDRHNVAQALLIASIPNDEASISHAVQAFPDRILGAFMLDPMRPDAGDRARRAFGAMGLKVACLFPAMHHFSVAESEGVRAVAAAASEFPGTAVFIHFGALSLGVRKRLGLPSRFDLRYSNPLDLNILASEFASTNFIIPHFGAGMFREALMVADLQPNVYLDTSSSNSWIRYSPTPTDLKRVFHQALAVVGHTRLLFGTDSSFFPRGWHAAIFNQQVDALGALKIDEEQARAIFGGNLQRLLTGAEP